MPKLTFRFNRLWLRFLIAIFFTVTICFDVFYKRVGLASFIIWIISILLVIPDYDLTGILKKIKIFSVNQNQIFLLLIITGALSCLYLLNQIPWHFHQDEFITAYASYTLPPIKKIDWYKGYPDLWVAQFSIIFHLIQAPFVKILGPSVTVVRISVWPYYIGIMVYLYFFSKKIFKSPKKALLNCLLFGFFTPSLYLFSMGLHFISSAYFFIAAVYYFLMVILEKKYIYAYLNGIFVALCLLTYPSSYAVIPVLFSATIYFFIRKNIRPKSIPLLIYAFFIFLITLAPFIVHALTIKNYFIERTAQTNIFWGSWSDDAKLIKSGFPILNILSKHFIDSFKSLFLPGIGGAGGYWFGKLSLFEPISASLFIGGSLLLFYKFCLGSKEYSLLFLSTWIPFIFLFVLTTHPPFFQRLSVIYSFMTIAVYLGLNKIFDYTSRMKIKKIVGMFILIIYLISNIFLTIRMINQDKILYNQNTRLMSNFITQNIKYGTLIQIAAFPSFHLESEMWFRLQGRYPLITNDKSEVLKTYNGDIILLVFKLESNERNKLKSDFPDIKIISEIEQESLNDVTMIIPGKFLKI